MRWKKKGSPGNFAVGTDPACIELMVDPGYVAGVFGQVLEQIADSSDAGRSGADDNGADVVLSRKLKPRRA